MAYPFRRGSQLEGAPVQIRARFLARSLVRIRCSFYTAFLKRFSREFLVKRKVKNPLVDVVSTSSVAYQNNPTPIRYRVVVEVPDETVFVS